MKIKNVFIEGTRVTSESASMMKILFVYLKKRIFVILSSFIIFCFLLSVIENDYSGIFDNMFQKVFLFVILLVLFILGQKLNKKQGGSF